MYALVWKSNAVETVMLCDPFSSVPDGNWQVKNSFCVPPTGLLTVKLVDGVYRDALTGVLVLIPKSAAHARLTDKSLSSVITLTVPCTSTSSKVVYRFWADFTS